MIIISIIMDQNSFEFENIFFFFLINGIKRDTSISRIRNMNIKFINLIDRDFFVDLILLNPHSKCLEWFFIFLLFFLFKIIGIIKNMVVKMIIVDEIIFISSFFFSWKLIFF